MKNESRSKGPLVTTGPRAQLAEPWLDPLAVDREGPTRALMLVKKVQKRVGAASMKTCQLLLLKQRFANMRAHL